MADFERGKANPTSLEAVPGVNSDMTELELTQVYNDSDRMFSAEQRGALSGLIEEARRKRLIDNSLAVAAKYSEILGAQSTQKIIAPQTFLLSAAKASEMGRCSPMVLSMAVALKNDKATTLLRNFYRAAAHTEGPNRKIIRALDVLHGTSVQTHLRPLKFPLNNEGTISQIVKKVKKTNGTGLFSMDSQGHAMMVGVTVDSAGAKTFHFYDPNIGLFSYLTPEELQTAMQRTVGTRAMGEQYNAFGNPDNPRYKLSEINTDTLGATPLRVQGTATEETLTVRELSEQEVEAVSCATGVRVRRAPRCGQIEAEIDRLENIQGAIFSNTRPEAGSSDFAFNYLQTLQTRNTEHAMGLDRDLDTLAKARSEMVTFRDQLTVAQTNGQRKEAKNLMVQSKTAYLNYLSALIASAHKIRTKTSV